MTVEAFLRPASRDNPTSPTTIVGTDPAGDQGAGASEQFGRFDLTFLNPGETTVRVTVTDSAGTVIGTTTTPITVRASSGTSSRSTCTAARARSRPA